MCAVGRLVANVWWKVFAFRVSFGAIAVSNKGHLLPNSQSSYQWYVAFACHPRSWLPIQGYLCLLPSLPCILLVVQVKLQRILPTQKCCAAWEQHCAELQQWLWLCTLHSEHAAGGLSGWTIRTCGDEHFGGVFMWTWWWVTHIRNKFSPALQDAEDLFNFHSSFPVTVIVPSLSCCALPAPGKNWCQQVRSAWISRVAKKGSSGPCKQYTKRRCKMSNGWAAWVQEVSWFAVFACCMTVSLVLSVYKAGTGDLSRMWASPMDPGHFTVTW